MLPEKLPELTWGATLRLERVPQGHRVVVSVPESFGDFAQARSVLFQKGGVSVAEYVPADTGLLQRAEGLVKYAASLGVGHGDREMQFFEDELRSLIEHDESFATACLRAVYGPLSVKGAPNMKYIRADDIRRERHSLPDPEPRQEAQLSEQAPLARHALDHPENLTYREGVLPRRGSGQSKPLRWRW